MILTAFCLYTLPGYYCYSYSFSSTGILVASQSVPYLHSLLVIILVGIFSTHCFHSLVVLHRTVPPQSTTLIEHRLLTKHPNKTVISTARISKSSEYGAWISQGNTYPQCINCTRSWDQHIVVIVILSSAYNQWFTNPNKFEQTLERSCLD